MQRPHQITTSGVAGGNNWSSGTYLYDGAGNVKRIGDQRYQYDRMSRLVEGEVLVGAQEKTQSVSYDAFGNILSLTTDGSFQSTPTSNATNRLNNADYDAGGNLTDVTLGGETYQYTYDPLNMMKYLQSDTGQARVIGPSGNRRFRSPQSSTAGRTPFRIPKSVLRVVDARGSHRERQRAVDARGSHRGRQRAVDARGSHRGRNAL